MNLKVMFPIKIAGRPELFISSGKSLTWSLVGGVRWHDILSGTILNYSLPAIIHLQNYHNERIIIPCSISPSSLVWRFKIAIEPTYYQPWINSDIDPLIIISALEAITHLPWIDSLQWTFPFWLSEYLINHYKKMGIGSNIQLTTRGTWVLQIDNSFEWIAKNKFTKSTRHQIKMASERGTVLIETPTVEQVDKFSELWQSVYESRGWQGTKFTKEFFHACRNYFKNSIRLVLASVDNVIVAGGLFLEEPSGSIYYLSAMDKKYKNYFPMDAIIGNEIYNLCKSGKKYLNFGGVGENLNLICFKQRWGAVEVPLIRFNHIKESKPLSFAFRPINSFLKKIVSWYFRYKQRKIELVYGKPQD